jgi:hypothetical protein
MFSVASSGECDYDCVVRKGLELRGDAEVVYYIERINENEYSKTKFRIQL